MVKLAEDHNEQGSENTPTLVEHSVDELAKGLATGTVSRRKALRMLGAALFGGMLASIPGVSWAQTGRFSHGCRIPGQVRVRGKCVCEEGTTLCGGSCCTTEFCCGGVNGVCCGNPNKTCVNGECICKPGLVACEGECCNEGDICADFAGGGKVCCSAGNVCGGLCCGGYFGAPACCNGVCCPEGETCVNGQCGCGTGPSCPAGTQCVPETGTCCPEGQWCPTDFSTANAICCPEGTVCTGDCSSFQQTCVTQCCPQERACISFCCAEGERCVQKENRFGGSYGCEPIGRG
jgi:hypothetical protein